MLPKVNSQSESASETEILLADYVSHFKEVQSGWVGVFNSLYVVLFCPVLYSYQQISFQNFFVLLGSPFMDLLQSVQANSSTGIVVISIHEQIVCRKMLLRHG